MPDEYDQIRKAVSEAVTEAVKDIMREETSPFYVEMEMHYKHHQFISRLVQWADNCESTFWKAFWGTLFFGILSLIVLGFCAWGGKAFKG